MSMFNKINIDNRIFKMLVIFTIHPRINPYINSHKKLTPTNGAVYQCRDPKKCKGKYARYMIQRNKPKSGCKNTGKEI